MLEDLHINVPNTTIELRSGDCIKIGRFSTKTWRLFHGWYTFGGNRPFCGWYLVCVEDEAVRPLQLPDLDDIYLITR